jgi:hypothetical protein
MTVRAEEFSFTKKIWSGYDNHSGWGVVVTVRISP